MLVDDEDAAGDAEAIFGGVPRSLMDCITADTDGGLLDGVPTGPFDVVKLGDGLGAATIGVGVFIMFADPAAVRESRLVGVGGKPAF